MRNGQNKERCLARVVGGGCVVLKQKESCLEASSGQPLGPSQPAPTWELTQIPRLLAPRKLHCLSPESDARSPVYSAAITLSTHKPQRGHAGSARQSFRKSRLRLLLGFLSKGVMILSVVDDMESPILKLSQFFSYNFYWFNYLACCLR